MIDGHHRLLAYHLKEEREGRSLKVPVECHTDIKLLEAIGRAARLNDREKVRVSQDDILTACWRVIGLGEMSIPETAASMNVSESTVSRMRKARRELLKKGFNEAVIKSWTWDYAKRMNTPLYEFREPTDDEKTKAKGAAWAKEINKAIGFQAIHDPEAMVLALANITHNGCLMDRMMKTEAFAEAFYESLERNGYRYHRELDEENPEDEEE